MEFESVQRVDVRTLTLPQAKELLMTMSDGNKLLLELIANMMAHLFMDEHGAVRLPHGDACPVTKGMIILQQIGMVTRVDEKTWQFDLESNKQEYLQ